ncbi:DUF2087 domain-containing protein [Salipaludibacillus daqingensis]|uniref:DUF2087 domain-containing protein n=1 Tax=Salipaludibacillus daqingensis TaxID=3041001 RepID=UPI00247498BE|nr:DUF2087 domain-containing protein [Salipaludibacillus daqingensis]
MADEEKFWDASVEELSKGFVYDSVTEEYVCLMCDERFEDGVIFERTGTFYEAKKAIVHHIREEHHSVFDYLLSMDKKYTGLSDHQKDVLRFFKKGLTDKEIAKEIGGSTSTIRNYRFKFREKEKQAKVFLTIMNELKHEKQDVHDLIPVHKGAKMVDERYATTVEEKDKVLKTYFKEGLNGPLESFPSKEKRKIIVLQHMMNRFDAKNIYKEKEVNEKLKAVYADYVTVRRYLIEYGFMDRSRDCSEYWVKK